MTNLNPKSVSVSSRRVICNDLRTKALSKKGA